ncbi:folylpolyglutamate synthase [Aspergillus lentulus]|uniref:tetrahydrofolate synthase n=1 Tax=Aspergillus lentulus TaxID=293939 RepID=A0AAN4PSQ2_ASPLE|nr:folylpolyglutamate synthase [Aspergillus lentulus]
MTKDSEYGIIVVHDPENTSASEDENRVNKTVFDLVAIHGLNGDPINTWTHTETRVMWLRDLLPAAIPDIRIMTFGYNARFKNFTAQQDLRSISLKLLAELVDLRTTEDIVDQRSAVLNVPHEITVPQFADHRNIARFRSSQDRSFRPVLSRLKEFAQTLRSGHPGGTRSFTDQNNESCIPFDLQTQPCSFFRGRDDVFDMLKTCFNEDQNQPQTRRTFAICGLGGTGKTQTALHYAVQNLAKYKSGIAFVNATSMASLTADFDRLHDLLRLGDSKDKIRAVKSWLSRPENSKWLLVFDNADDLDTVPLHKFYPAVNWGHIIITSRDQAVIGSIAENGHILSPLREGDAVQLLLEKSGIQHPTEGDIEDARTVTGLLGSLPLALVQAGAFVRSRHRSLQQYCRLYRTRRDDLLGFASRLGDSEKAVLTTWEINFKQVERESPGAASLLLLVSFLEQSSIPEMLLHRGTTPQRRWSEDGEMIEVTAETEGVEKHLVQVIQGDFEFDMAVEKLLSFSLISCNKESEGLRSFSIHPLVQYCAIKRLSPVDVRKWRWQALLLVCHAFPRNRFLEPLNGEVGRTLLPHLSRVLSEYDAMCLEHGDPASFRHELASTLLAASRFSNAKWKVEAIDRTKKLLEGDNDRFLNAWLAFRESSVMRMSGKLRESESALYKFLHDAATPKEKELELSRRYNAQRGELVISFAENLIREGKLVEAKAELTEWSPLDIAPSSLEKITSRARDITLGKTLRLQGLFHEALAQLNGVLQDCLLDEYFEGTGWYRVLLSEVADLRCELGQPLEAEKLLIQELTPMREKGTQDIATGRRLRMSLAETYLERNMFAQAEELLLELHRAFSSSDEPDYNAQFNIFRLWISLARISHKQSEWEQAILRWRNALSALGRLGQDKSFNAGLNALKLLETRRRKARPTSLITSVSTVQGTTTMKGNSLKGLPSLVGMKEWLQLLGHSDNAVNSLNVIHVSGTKGKGSTCAFTRAILRAHGMRTGFPKRIGLYTSPHLQCIRERIQLDDHPVTEDLFTKYFFEVWDRIMPGDIEQDSGNARQPRYLQFLVLLAFHTFIREGVQAAIFEVHHGGEYDATNVIQSPVATGITSLGMDHVAQLGPTIETIAWHKAGIFKPGAPAFSVNQKPGPAEVMRNRALDKGTTLTFVSTNECLPTDGRVLSVPVQRLNCSLALELSRAFIHAKAPGHTIIDEDIYHGVESFSLTGRFEVIDEGQVQWFVDGAHNVLSLEEAAEWFAKNASNDRKCRTLIFSHLSEARDGVTLVRSLAHALFKNKVKPDHVIFTTYQEKEDDSIDRVTEASEARIHDLCALYSSVWKELDPQATVTSTPTIERAVTLARIMGGREDGMQVLVTGSLHMVGGALRFLRPSSH